MYTLFYSPGSASMAPHAMLEETGAKYALKRVDISADKPRDPDYLKLNPLGRVPTLAIAGGETISEIPRRSPCISPTVIPKRSWRRRSPIHCAHLTING